MAEDELGRHARLPGPHPAPARRRSSSCARSSRARRACGCWARGTRSATSPTPPSWSRLEGLPADVEVDRAAGTVSCSAALKYGELATGAGRARASPLHNLASLPHISVAGAVATATHGSGDANGNLATAVAGARARDLRRATSSRRPRRRRTSTASSSGLGALGAVTRHHARRRARLRGAPARLRGAGLGRAGRALRRDHRERLQRQRLHPLGPTRRPGVGQEPRHRRAREPRGELFGAVAGDARPPPDPRPGPGQLHAAARRPRPAGRTACRTSAWASRPATARRSSPSTMSPRRARRRGDRGRARARRRRSRPCSRSREIRTVAADGLWMSPQYGQDTVGAALHLDARPRGRRARARRPRGRARAVRRRARTGARSSSRTPRPSRRATSAWRTSRAWPRAWTRAAPSATTGSPPTSSAMRREHRPARRRGAGAAPRAVLRPRLRAGHHAVHCADVARADVGGLAKGLLVLGMLWCSWVATRG